MSLSFRVVRGREVLAYVPWLTRLYLEEERRHESLGFIPLQAYERDAAIGRISIGLLDNEPMGFIYGGALVPYRDAKIHQAVIDFDLRRQYWGALLVGDYMQIAEA